MGGKPLYFGSTHLILTGAKTLQPLFKLLVKEIKNK